LPAALARRIEPGDRLGKAELAARVDVGVGQGGTH
jgi:hypothetical protein